jgi:hypothetical protein
MSTSVKYRKILTANDIGITNSHQAGICIPKSGATPMHILPYLDPKIKNPFAWISCIDEESQLWKLKYIYYNSKLHKLDSSVNGREYGTRNEYRITFLSKYLKNKNAQIGDSFEINKKNDIYEISLRRFKERINAPIILRGWSTVC